MTELAIKVSFQNESNPQSSFDLVRLEEMLIKKRLDHSPEQLHKVDFYVILFITQGKGYHTLDFTDYSYKQGTIITIRKDQIHKFFKTNTAKGFMLLFKEEFLLSYLEKLEGQKALQLFNELLGVPKIQLGKRDFSAVAEIVRRMEKEYFGQFDTYSLGIIRSELHILITKLFRIKSASNKITDRKYLTEFIQLQELVENNVKSTIKVKDYAQMMAVSTKTVNTICRSIVHKSAKEFIDEINLKQIKRLLINTSLSVKEIAFACGFEETPNFYKYFKRQVNMTPEQFRSNF